MLKLSPVDLYVDQKFDQGFDMQDRFTIKLIYHSEDISYSFTSYQRERGGEVGNLRVFQFITDALSLTMDPKPSLIRNEHGLT